jgi:hypothetical protein
LPDRLPEFVGPVRYEVARDMGRGSAAGRHSFLRKQ